MSEAEGSDGVELRVVRIIRKRLSDAGLVLLERPLGEDGENLEPCLPYDLTVIDDVCLGRLYGQFCLMAQYSQMQAALYATRSAVFRQTEKLIRAEEWMRQEGTVKDKEHSNEASTRVKNITFKAQVESGTERLTTAMLESYVIGRDACSRELTRRQITTERR